MVICLANDDATLEIARGVPEAVKLSDDLTMFCRDKQDKVYIQQNITDNFFICGITTTLSRLAPSTGHTDMLTELQELLS